MYALKNYVLSLLMHKTENVLLYFALFLALFCFAFFTSVARTQFSLTVLVPRPGSKHLVTTVDRFESVANVAKKESKWLTKMYNSVCF